jgi:modulator of FtsH protease HflK
MSDRHEHSHDEPPQAPVPLMPDDAGSRALSDALRSSFLIVKILMALLVVLFFASGFFTVGPQERAVILRFGKPVGEGDRALLGPGAHWSWPAPIDKVERIPFSQVQSVNASVGWYATTPEQEATGTEPEPREMLNPALDSYLITGDANIVHARATLRYRLSDPLRFVFGFTNAPALVTNVLNEALYFAAAQFSVDDVLTRKRTAFREMIERRIDQVAAKQQLGISVEQVTLTVSAPRKLRAKFDAVAEAAFRGEKVRSEAQSYANDTLSRAEAEKAGRLGAAQSERNRLVETVKAEAGRFSDVLPKYRQNPELFMRTWQAEVVQRVFTNAQDLWYRPAYMADWLDLTRAPLKPKPAPEAPKDDHH